MGRCGRVWSKDAKIMAVGEKENNSSGGAWQLDVWRLWEGQNRCGSGGFWCSQDVPELLYIIIRVGVKTDRILWVIWRIVGNLVDNCSLMLIFMA